MNVVSTGQHLPMSQTDAPNFSAGGQPWFPTGNQNVQSVLPMQQAVEQTWSSTVTQNIKPVTPLQQNGEQNAGAQQWFPNGNQNVESSTPQQNEQSAGVVTLVRVYRVYFNFFMYTNYVLLCYLISHQK